MNKAVAANLSVQHVGRANHKHNLEVKQMICTDTELKSCIDTVHETM